MVIIRKKKLDLLFEKIASLEKEVSDLKGKKTSEAQAKKEAEKKTAIVNEWLYGERKKQNGK